MMQRIRIIEKVGEAIYAEVVRQINAEETGRGTGFIWVHEVWLPTGPVMIDAVALGRVARRTMKKMEKLRGPQLSRRRP